MSRNNEGLVAKAHPSKAFFIDMLTRDLTLSDCILDLIDNSIHSLIKKSKLDVSQHLFTGSKVMPIKGLIDLQFSPSRFVLVDDCGGISVEDAKDDVFLLGNPATDGRQPGLGVYGIGMKRAFFKIGDRISISSHTSTEEFRIDIDVNEWKAKAEDWTFPFSFARQRNSKRGGTTIAVSDVHATVREQFQAASFRNLLLEKISTAYALFLKAGLKIRINDEPAVPDMPEFGESASLRTHRHMVRVADVDILFMVGVSPERDKTPRGWYVFCNGRLVLDADQTRRTGWGVESHPHFHTKYNHFLGYVYFRSRDVQKLPWTTTKDGIVWESPIYQRALSEMRILSRPVLDFLNSLYSDVRAQSEPERVLLKEAKAVDPTEVAQRKDTVFQAKATKEPGDSEISIQYKRPKRKIDEIKKKLGKLSMSAYRVGEYTFDWFYERNCK